MPSRENPGQPYRDIRQSVPWNTAVSPQQVHAIPVDKKYYNLLLFLNVNRCLSAPVMGMRWHGQQQ